MKNSYDTESDVLDFREMLLEHMAENYPGVTLTAEIIERRSRQAAAEFGNPHVSITQALENAMSVLLQDYERQKKETDDFPANPPRPARPYLQDRIRQELLALCEPELRRLARSTGFERSEEFLQLSNLILPIAGKDGDPSVCN